MNLRSGVRLGPYEIVAPIGAGGMGEVYKATDTRLGRAVAIKILPAEISSDAKLKIRFEREAKTISSLNHPHICSLFDVGENYLVMEYCEGQTLAQRLERGALPLDQVLEYGIQIAEALDKAHRSGIIHRDLKPSNIMITKSGVKLLDFGLAKETHAVKEPVITTATMATEERQIVGTIQYMSPELLSGTPATEASDIFALGLVLYEMATGKPAFKDENRTKLIVAIVERDPEPLRKRSPASPRALEVLIRECLEKDPSARIASANEVGERLKTIGISKGWPLSAGAVAFSGLGLLALVATAAIVLYSRADQSGIEPSSAALPMRFVQLTEQPGMETDPAISPDGKFVAYVSKGDIYLQRVGGRSPFNLTPNSPGADTEPAFSRDGQFIAFRSERDGGGIFVMGATGESVRKISEDGFTPSWSPDHREIVVSTEPLQTNPTFGGVVGELFAIDVATGSKRQITKIADFAAAGPSWSPNGHRIVFWHSQLGYRRLMTVRADGSGATILLHDPWRKFAPTWSSSGNHIYFASDRGGSINLWRVAVDESAGVARGEPEPVTPPARLAWPLAVAGDAFVYTARDYRWRMHRLNLDENGNVLSGPLPITNGTLLPADPTVSPDGRWIGFRTDLQRLDLYIVGADGANLRRVTDDAADDQGPSWSPDGRKLAFRSRRSRKFEIWTVKSDGSGMEQITDWKNTVIMRVEWSPDGTTLAVQADGAECETGTCLVDLREPLPNRKPVALPAYRKGWLVWLQDWSPDGSSLIGIARTKSPPLQTAVIKYSVRDRTYETILEKTEIYFPRWVGNSGRFIASGGIFLSGARKILLFDGRNAPQVMYDAGPDTIDPRLAVSADGRSVYFVQQSNESDIWIGTPATK